MGSVGVVHHHREAPQSFKIYVIRKDEKPVNLLNLQNPLTL